MSRARGRHLSGAFLQSKTLVPVLSVNISLCHSSSGDITWHEHCRPSSVVRHAFYILTLRSPPGDHPRRGAPRHVQQRRCARRGVGSDRPTFQTPQDSLVACG